MSRRRRYEDAVDRFIGVVHKRAPQPEDALTSDEVLDLFLDFRTALETTALDRLRGRTPFSRPCYDKPHRCPGWAGGGWRYARVDRCTSGSLGRVPYRRRYWLGARCPECGLYVLPIATRWLDPAWLWWRVRHPRWPHFLHPRVLLRRWRNR